MSIDINFYKLSGFTRPKSLESIKVKDNLKALQERNPTLASGSFTINNKKIRVNTSDNLSKVKDKINQHPDFKAKIVESDDGTQRLKIYSKKDLVKIDDHDNVLADINAKELIGKDKKHLIQFTRKIDSSNYNKSAVKIEYIAKKQGYMQDDTILINETLTRHLAENHRNVAPVSPTPVLAPAPKIIPTPVAPTSQAPLNAPVVPIPQNQYSILTQQELTESHIDKFVMSVFTRILSEESYKRKDLGTLTNLKLIAKHMATKTKVTNLVTSGDDNFANKLKEKILDNRDNTIVSFFTKEFKLSNEGTRAIKSWIDELDKRL